MVEKSFIEDISVGELLTMDDKSRGKDGRFWRSMTLGAMRRDEIVQNWLKAYSPNTQELYSTSFNIVLDKTGLTPKDYHAMDTPKIKEWTKRVMGELVLEHREYTGKHVMAAMKSFCAHYGKPKLEFSFSERIRVGKIKTEYVLLPPEIWGVAEAASSIANPVNPRNKAIVKTDWVTSLRKNALNSLRCGAVMGYSESDCPIPLRVGNERQEIGVGGLWCIDDKIAGYGVNYFYTFIAKEAFLDVQEWLQYRKANIGDYDKKDFLFCAVKGEQAGKGSVDGAGKVGMQRNGIYRMYKRALKAYGNVDPRTTSIHQLRDAFKSVMIRAEVDGELREAMMAHRPTGSRGNYFDYHDVEMARTQYKKADWSRTGTHRIDRMEQENTTLKFQVKELQEKVLALSNATTKKPDIDARVALIERYMFTVRSEKDRQEKT